MEKKLYAEMESNFNSINGEGDLTNKSIFLFGHCSATLELIDFLENRGIHAVAILDNNHEKLGVEYKGVKVVKPSKILEVDTDDVRDLVVLIVSRFYASMKRMLRDIGYKGRIYKLIDYNTYADYSLSEDTVSRMAAREKHGEELLERLNEKYPGCFKVYCPFNAIGDIYFMASYFPAFAKVRGIEKQVFCVSEKALRDVIHMFDESFNVEVYEQKELDALIQAVLYKHDKSSFIAHQDRPYVINLSKALYIKRIPLEQIYCCGVYGLPKNTAPARPCAKFSVYGGIEKIPEGRGVIFSPFAKSVTAIGPEIWQSAVKYYTSKGLKCYTNVVGNEQPLEGTEAISPSLLEIRSVVERAGLFIGIRSGLCDILRNARAKKIVLYPDYNYSDTKWKAVDMYYIEEFDYNIVATEKIEWERL